MRALSHSRLLLAAFPLALLLSCSNPTDICACSPLSPTGVLHGYVASPEGPPVAGARVIAEVGLPGCTGGFRKLGETHSAADGSYRATVYADHSVLPGACLRARAEPPTGSTWRESEPKPFAMRFSVGEPQDSVRVDLALRAE